MEELKFRIIFWGVRGSLPAPGADSIIYGGNTSCVQVQIGDKLIILDAGTGICKLGKTLTEKGDRVKGSIFISHLHWDHIQGFPFFLPAYKKGNSFDIYGKRSRDLSFADNMSNLMIDPHFPVSLSNMDAELNFYDVESGQTVELEENIIVKTTNNNHPNGCLSYRIEYGDKSCCYITDTEHYDHIDTNLCDFIEGTDAVIYDSNYTDGEYAAKKGWGHSTWQEGIKLAKAASAKRLFLFHHDMYRSDKQMEAIEKQANKVWGNCIAAKEGMEVTI